MKKVSLFIKKDYNLDTYYSSRDIPTSAEIDEFNDVINKNEIDLLNEMIDSHPIRYFFNLKLDKNGFTLFHKLIIFDQVNMFNSALELFKRKFLEEKGDESYKDRNSISSNIISTKDEEKNSTDSEEKMEIKLSSLLSLRDKDGNTPILLASYKGKVSIITKMIELGVKYNVKNKAGLNVIHMAAQNDMGNIIVYFKEKYNYDLYQNDNQGNNSIHWACSNSAKYSLEYLLYYLDEKNIDIINSINKNGQTALHLAILTNTNKDIIKKLLKKGSKIDIKDKNNLTVLDITSENLKYESINKLILDYTKTNCLGLNFHINDFKNKYFKFIIFIFLSIFQIINTNYLILPFLDENLGKQIQIKLIYYILSLSFFWDFIYIINSSSGEISDKIDESLLDLVIEEKDISKLCPFCMVYKKTYSKHCFICNKCIEIYDHHCHWINNCIGAQNKKQFIIFLIILLSFLSFSYFISLEVLITPIKQTLYNESNIMNTYKNKNIISSILCIINLFFCFPVGYILKNQIETECPPKPKKNELKEYRKELKEINNKNNIINQLQIKED